MSNPRAPGARLAALIAAISLGCASGRTLMPTPVIYTGAEAKPLFTGIPEAQQSPPIDLFFLTDRAPAAEPDAPTSYTSDRSRSLAFGVTTVEFGPGPDLSWEEIVAGSTTEDRPERLAIELGPTRELARYPPIPYAVTSGPRGFSRDPEVLAAHEGATRALHGELSRRLAASPRKELVLFVHGYANTFEDAALTMGELCHFLGREFVCGIFTWPAGGGRGVLMGYEYDYESGVFASEHLRKALRTLAQTPGLERMHLLAHSRGTGVLSTALAGVGIESYLLGTQMAERYKIANVLLMAPDIDADIAPMRILTLASDPDLPFAGRPKPDVTIRSGIHLTLYVSPDDRALAASSFLFGSLARLGRMDETMLTPRAFRQIQELGLMDVIQVLGRTDFFGHGYFISNPRASADIIALLRYRARPGDPSRPLEEIDRPFWRIPAD